MKNEDEATYFTTEHYELLNISQCHDIVARYAIENDKRPGTYHLEDTALSFVGIARVVAKTFKNPCGTIRQPALVDSYSEYRPVGIIISVDGEMMICNEDDNFAAFGRLGETSDYFVEDPPYLDLSKYPLAENKEVGDDRQA